MTDIQNRIIKAALKERVRQDEKWGEQNHIPIIWNSILVEEVGEVSKEVNDAYWARNREQKAPHMENMCTELVQVIAVTMAMLECIERNTDFAVQEDGSVVDKSKL